MKKEQEDRLGRFARHGLVVVGVGVAAVALAACSSDPAPVQTVSCGGSSPKLTVQGTGMATGTPDLATLTVDVHSQASNASAALGQNNDIATKVIDALGLGGVAKKDVQTTGLNIQPQYGTVNGNTVLMGYSVDNSIVASLRNLANAGSIVDAVSGAGGNAVQITSLSFSINDPRSLEDKARQDAVHQAVSHADTMAASAGEALGPVCSLTDNASNPPTPLQDNTFGAAGVVTAAPAAVPLEAGSQQGSAQVTIVYALRQRSKS